MLNFGKFCGVYVRNSSTNAQPTGVVLPTAAPTSALSRIGNNDASDESAVFTVGLAHVVSVRPCEETIEAAGAFPRKQNMALHEVTVHNVGQASTLTLLRIRARDIRAQYVRMWRCYANNRVQPFVYDSHEGDGDIVQKVRNLRKYIAHHITVLESLRILVDRDESSRSRLKRANRSTGYLTRLLRERNGAVVDELVARYAQDEGQVVNYTVVPNDRHDDGPSGGEAPNSSDVNASDGAAEVRDMDVTTT